MGVSLASGFKNVAAAGSKGDFLAHNLPVVIVLGVFFAYSKDLSFRAFITDEVCSVNVDVVDRGFTRELDDDPVERRVVPPRFPAVV